MFEPMKNAAQSKRPEPHQQTTFIGNDENHQNDTAETCIMCIIGVIVAVLCFMAECGFSRPLSKGERVATRHSCGAFILGYSFGRRTLTVAPVGDPSGSLFPFEQSANPAGADHPCSRGWIGIQAISKGTPIMIFHHALKGRASSAVDQAVSTAPRIAANAAHALGVL